MRSLLARVARRAAVFTGSVLSCALATGALAGAAQLPTRARGTAAPTASAATPVHLTGAGSTFDAPFFASAFARYHRLHPNVTLRYDAVGSGLGITRFSAGAVDFGATDVPMTPTEQSLAKGDLVQVPVALGAVVVSYDLPYLGSSPLRLTGAVLARIYLGTITRWDDPAIEALNPRAFLPHEDITVIHRSDSSGTTYIFTDFLSSTSTEWSAGPGRAKSVNWPVGLGGKGSDGVAQLLRRVPGSIGYFELTYAQVESLPFSLIANSAGHFVPPFASNVAADAARNPNVSAGDFSIVNEPGSTSYPISGYSWMLLYAHQANQRVGSALVRLATWLTHAGQARAAASYYVALPPNIETLASRTISRLVGPSGNPLSG